MKKIISIVSIILQMVLIVSVFLPYAESYYDSSSLIDGNNNMGILWIIFLAVGIISNVISLVFNKEFHLSFVSTGLTLGYSTFTLMGSEYTDPLAIGYWLGFICSILLFIVSLIISIMNLSNKSMVEKTVVNINGNINPNTPNNSVLNNLPPQSSAQNIVNLYDNKDQGKVMNNQQYQNNNNVQNNLQSNIQGMNPAFQFGAPTEFDVNYNANIMNNNNMNNPMSNQMNGQQFPNNMMGGNPTNQFSSNPVNQFGNPQQNNNIYNAFK